MPLAADIGDAAPLLALRQPVSRHRAASDASIRSKPPGHTTVWGDHATRTRARSALFFETTATPGARPSLREQRSLFEDWTRERLATLGAGDPDTAARAVLAMSAGIIVNRLTIAPDTPIRPAVELAVRACIGA